MNPTKSKGLSILLFGLLGTLAAVSLAQGIRNATRRSSDFQWSGAHLLADGVDPYRVMLEGDPKHQLLMNQVPNYLHVLYVVLWPLGKMSFGRAELVWAALNTCFAVAAVVALASVYRLETSKAVLLGLLLAASTPFRIAIGTGQMSLLELMLLTMALWAPKRAGFALGLSYFKYSFSPIVVFYAVLQKAWSQLVISMAVVITGALIFWRMAGGQLLQVATEPFRVSRVGVAIADADLVSLTKLVHPSWEPMAVAVGILCSALLAWTITRVQPTLGSSAAALAPASLTLLPHGTYDFVLLAVPAAFLLSLPSRSLRVRIGAGCIAVLWFVFKFLPFAGATVLWLLVRLVLLGFVFFSVLEWPSAKNALRSTERSFANAAQK